MLVIVVVLAGVLVILAFASAAQVRQSVAPRRLAVLLGATTCATWGAATTELLSLLSAINRLNLAMTWVILALIAAVVLVAQPRHWAAAFVPSLQGKPSSRSGWLMVGLLGVMLSLTLVTALLAPPNTWDSMTYHLSRVMHWAQQGSLDHYPTHISRQLQMPPLAEVGILHLHVLSGGDRFANGVQWLSMAGCLVAVSVIAAGLGAGAHGQLLAVVICAAIPSGILQSSSTQNDYVLAFWLACFVVAVQRIAAESGRWVNIMLAAGAFALMLLTKGTGYVYAAPVAVVLAATLLVRDRWRGLAAGLVIVVAALALNAGHYQRNTAKFGSPLGETSGYLNASPGPRTVASNLLRGLSLHLALPIAAWNHGVESAVRQAHGVLGISADDPATTYLSRPYHVPSFANHEDIVVNNLHLLGIVLCFAALALPQVRRQRAVVGYALLVAAWLLALSAAVKWQPWLARLQLPLFVLASPWIATVLTKALSRGRADFVAVIFLAWAMPFAVSNRSRPLFIGLDTAAAKQGQMRLTERTLLRAPRHEHLFNNRPDLMRPYMQAVDVLIEHDCHHVGLILGGDDWEYPLWALLQERNWQVRIEHVRVPGDPATTPDQRPRHDAVVVVGSAQAASDPWLPRWYEPAWSDDQIAVWLRRDKVAR